MTTKLKPFFSFFGGKWRVARKYPVPRYGNIVEPFAGSAGFSTRYPERDVVLVERDPKIAATWRYLIGTSPGEILALPDILPGQTVADLGVCQEAGWLIGWWINKGSAAPHLSPSSNMRKSLSGEQPKDPPSGWWGSAIRQRLADQVQHIKHWKLLEGTCLDVAPDIEATWFIDPPYERAGKRYTYGAKTISYSDLSDWCRTRTGQVMVCENRGAEWMPFKPFLDIKAYEGSHGGADKGVHGGRVSKEVLWTNDEWMETVII